MIRFNRRHWGLAVCSATAVHLLLIAGWFNLTVSPPANEPLSLSPLPSPVIQVSAMAQPQATAETDTSLPVTAPRPSIPTVPVPRQVDLPAPQVPALQPALQGSLQLQIDTQLPSMTPPAAQPLAAPQTVYEQSEVDQVPTGLYQPPPDYPMQARRRQQTGLVRVRLLIDPQGLVEQVVIVAAEPPGVFEASVRAALSRWKFEPGQVGGQAVSTWVEVPVRFELSR